MQLLKHLANAMQRAEGFVLERALVGFAIWPDLARTQILNYTQLKPVLRYVGEGRQQAHAILSSSDDVDARQHVHGVCTLESSNCSIVFAE